MISFNNLWENHPTITGDNDPCTTNGKKNYPDQCAIRVGVALAKCGVKTSALPGATHCWHGHKKSQGYVIRAEELANGLDRYPITGIHKAIKVNPDEFAKKLYGRKGIIFFKDYWQRTNGGKKESFRNRSGDHIDLWNGLRLTDRFTWFRIHARLGSFGIHSFRDDISDFENSKAIWFWRVL